MQIVASGAWCHPNCARWIQMVQISTANKGTTVLSKDESRWEIILLNIKSRHKYSSNWVKNSHTGKMGILHYFCQKKNKFDQSKQKLQGFCHEEKITQQGVCQLFWEILTVSNIAAARFHIAGTVLKTNTTQNALFIARGGGIFKFRSHCSGNDWNIEPSEWLVLGSFVSGSVHAMS